MADRPPAMGPARIVWIGSTRHMVRTRRGDNAQTNKGKRTEQDGKGGGAIAYRTTGDVLISVQPKLYFRLWLRLRFDLSAAWLSVGLAEA